MKIFFTNLFMLLILLVSTSFVEKSDWVNLLDKDLSKWGKYLSYRHGVNYHGEVPKNSAGKPLKPIGFSKDAYNVFTVKMTDGIPVLRVSGEIYGCVFTKQEFGNYHLKLQVKFGTKKWIPRLNEPKDSGIIYHSFGVAGTDYWRSWMPGQEFQIMEGGCGDYWNIGNTQCNIKTSKYPAKKDTLVYNAAGKDTPVGSGSSFGNFVQQGKNYEKANGEWNTLELICFNDKSIYIVNGHVANVLTALRYLDGNSFKPLVKGKLQLQSEAAETFYKNVMIKSIKEVPAAYASYLK